ncbi:MAG: SIR2 family protein, partial [Candidatus Rokuibacteriota bacterium]
MDIDITYDKNRLYIDTLIKQLAQRPQSIVPFIGAGCSMASGYPGWRRFLVDLLDVGLSAGLISAAEVADLRRTFDRRPLEEVADRLWASLGSVTFRDKLQASFRRNGRQIRGAVCHVPPLATNLVLTTNYDQVVEDVWDEYLRRTRTGGPVQVLTPSDEDAFERALADPGHFVFKLHGDVERPQTWVLTKHDYHAKYHGAFSSLPLFLRRLMGGGCIPWFLGCSLQDERILDAMRAAGRSGYAVL